MGESISIREILGMFVRGGKLSLIMLCVLGILLGGIKAVKVIPTIHADQTVTKDQMDDYEKKLEEYETSYNNIEGVRKLTQDAVDDTSFYLANSVLMHIDPYNKIMGKVYYSITIEEINTNDDEAEDIDETLYQLSRVSNRYLMMWDAADLKSICVDTSIEGVEDKYLREVLTLEVIDEDALLIQVVGEDEAEVQMILERACKEVTGWQNEVEKAAPEHELSKMTLSVKSTIDTDLYEKQRSLAEYVDHYSKEVANYERELKKLVKPVAPTAQSTSISGALKAIVKNGILGAAAGYILSLVWILISNFFAIKLNSSNQASRALGLDAIGVFSTGKDLWNRLADKIVGEVSWRTKEERNGYVASRIKMANESAHTILVISSLRQSDTLSEKQKELQEVLQNKDCNVRFVNEGFSNGEAIEALKTSDVILFMEDLGKSRMEDMARIVKLMDQIREDDKAPMLLV